MLSRFSNQALLVIVSLVTLSLIGLVVIQIKWINSAILVNEQRFNERVCSSVYAIEENYGASLENYLGSAGNNTLALDLLLKAQFTHRNLPVTFNHGVYDLTQRKVIGDLEDKDLKASVSMPFACSYQIAIFFPEKKNLLLAELSETLAPSITFILLIIGSFAYILVVLNKQKKFSEIKNHFINSLTHEFKTPLASIFLTNRVLRERNPERFDDKDYSYFQIIEKESTRLNSQIDKILQMAQIDAGVFNLEKQEIDIHAIIERVVQSFEPLMKKLEGKIALNLNAERPVMTGDEVHITNLIYNLVDNACKYSARSPEISITTFNTEEGLSISVKDNGIGIKKETQKQIFEKFYREPTGDVHTVKGFGLGLSYVKSIVDAHRGKIKLISEINKGSEFKVTLPLT